MPGASPPGNADEREHGKGEAGMSKWDRVARRARTAVRAGRNFLRGALNPLALIGPGPREHPGVGGFKKGAPKAEIRACMRERLGGPGEGGPTRCC